MAYIPSYHPPYIDCDAMSRKEMKRLDKKRKKRETKEAKEKAKKTKWIKKHREQYYERLWNELKALIIARMEINKPSDEPLPSDNVRKLGAFREDRIILETMSNKESK